MNVLVGRSPDRNVGQVLSLPRAATCIFISALMSMMISCSVVTAGVAKVLSVGVSTDALSYCCWEFSDLCIEGDV